MMKRQRATAATRGSNNGKATPPFPTKQMFVLGMNELHLLHQHHFCRH